MRRSSFARALALPALVLLAGCQSGWMETRDVSVSAHDRLAAAETRLLDAQHESLDALAHAMRIRIDLMCRLRHSDRLSDEQWNEAHALHDDFERHRALAHAALDEGDGVAVLDHEGAMARILADASEMLYAAEPRLEEMLVDDDELEPLPWSTDDDEVETIPWTGDRDEVPPMPITTDEDQPDRIPW